MLPPGSITDVPGLTAGHFTDLRRPTGCTVVLCPQGAACGVDVRGASPGTRETDLLSPLNRVAEVHAVLLSGGSAFGLDAATGVMRWLEQQGAGLPVGPVRVPIVPAAVLFDLWVGDASVRPDAAAGLAACAAASAQPLPAGSLGAGAGATVGKLWGLAHAMKGGIGGASVKVGGITVAAVVAVNALGDVTEPGSDHVLAGSRAADGRTARHTVPSFLRGDLPATLATGMATTIGVIGTDAQLDKAQCTRLAQCGHDGLARSIAPVHTQFDGDTLFALATGASGLPGDPVVLGALATHVVAQAVLDAVRQATGLPQFPSARDLGWA